MTNHNGAVAEMEAEAMRIEKLMTPVDTTAPKTYTTKSGVVLELRPISPVLIRRWKNNTYGRPQPPVVESVVGPQKKKVREVNPEDPEYLAALAEWEEAHNEQLVMYLFTRGILSEPETADIERLQMLLPGESDMGLKYSWVLEMLDGDDEITALSFAIMGLTAPTEKGISEAEDRFQRDGERQADSGVSATED